MMGLEIAVLVFVFWNAMLQTGWFFWSKRIHDRKHFTDDAEAAGAEIDIITSIQTYVDAKVENELVIKARDKEWSEFMKTKEPEEPFIPYEDFKETEITEDPNAHLERDEKGNYNHEHVEGALDGLFDK